METSRNFGASIEIEASPEAVWAAVSDPRRMPDFSPELRRAYVVGKPGLGATIIGINRRGAVVWPTTSKVVRWEPRRAIAWKTRESGATWVYELEPVPGGTRVTARRVLHSLTIGSKVVGPMVGGVLGHDVELRAGLAATLGRIKEALEVPGQ